MYISKLKAKNFKGFEKAEFEFGDVNILEGKNGTGKSAIKDAIIFCFFNRTADGLLTKADKLIKEGEKKAMVEITFSNGEALRRDRSGNSTKLSYLDSSQSDEDSDINQKQIEDIIKVDYDTFQCIFNVGYFMSLPDKDKRVMMLNLAKPIDRQKLFDKFKIGKEAIDKYNLKLTNIPGQYKELLKEKKETEYAIDITKLNIQNLEEIKVPKAEHKDQTEALRKAEDKIDEAVKANRDWDEYKEKLSDISLVIERNKEIENKIKETKIEEITKPTNAKVVALYKERERLLDEKEKVSKNSNTVELINKLTRQINELQSTISIPEDICPTCHQTIEPSHKDSVAAKNKQIMEEREGLTHALGIAQIQFDKELEEYDKKIDILKQQILQEEADYDDQWTKFKKNEENKIDVRVLKARIQEIKEPKKPETPPVDILKLQEDREKIKEAQGKYIAEKTEILSLEKRKDDELQKKAELLTKKKTLEDELAEIKYLCNVFSPKGLPSEEIRMKLEPIMEIMNEFLPKSKIELLELLKSGMEYREVFQVFVRGKEYARMSTGEKKKVDIAISKAINKLSGSKLNMFFIDNAESIDKIPDLVAQTFLASVTQDEELKLTTRKAEEKEVSPF
jgi:DNA repair exonuclease SbcCD ATPase subunit